MKFQYSLRGRWIAIIYEACIFSWFCESFPGEFFKRFSSYFSPYTCFLRRRLPKFAGLLSCFFFFLLIFAFFIFYKYIVFFLLVVSLVFMILLFARFLIWIMHCLTGVIGIWQKEKKTHTYISVSVCVKVIFWVPFGRSLRFFEGFESSRNAFCVC